MKKGYLDRSYFSDKYDIDIVEQWEDTWQKYTSDDLLAVNNERVELTRKGLLRVDALLPAFFESEHQGVRYT